jgi:hypothetical protein
MSNRVATLKACLGQNWDIVVNDIIPFGEAVEVERRWLSHRLKSGESLEIENIIEGNFLSSIFLHLL